MLSAERSTKTALASATCTQSQSNASECLIVPSFGVVYDGYIERPDASGALTQIKKPRGGANKSHRVRAAYSGPNRCSGAFELPFVCTVGNIEEPTGRLDLRLTQINALSSNLYRIVMCILAAGRSLRPE